MSNGIAEFITVYDELSTTTEYGIILFCNPLHRGLVSLKLLPYKNKWNSDTTTKDRFIITKVGLTKLGTILFHGKSVDGQPVQTLPFALKWLQWYQVSGVRVLQVFYYPKPEGVSSQIAKNLPILLIMALLLFLFLSGTGKKVLKKVGL